MLDVLNWLAEHSCCGAGLLLFVLLVVGSLLSNIRVVFRGYDPNAKDPRP